MRRRSRQKKLLDLCCMAGGTSMGYHMAGFQVTGVDIDRQPNFPFEFMRDDITQITDKQAITIRRNFDAVAASPPCKGYGVIKTLSSPHHPKLIPYVRELFEFIDLPYIIENVVGAPLSAPVQVCGSGLGLRVQRHRLFESNCDLIGVRCNHRWQDRDLRYLQIPNGRGSERMRGIVYVYGRGDGSHFRNYSQRAIWSHAMGIDWMSIDELSQAIPPLYTYHLGQQLMEYV
jgi:DNA (cytosine-5)-methyltransferase 1